MIFFQIGQGNVLKKDVIFTIFSQKLSHKQQKIPKTMGIKIFN